MFLGVVGFLMWAGGIGLFIFALKKHTTERKESGKLTDDFRQLEDLPSSPIIMSSYVFSVIFMIIGFILFLVGINSEPNIPVDIY